MNIKVVWPLAVNTFKESIKGKWLIMFAVVFFLIAIDVPLLFLASTGLLPPNYLLNNFPIFATSTFAFLPLLALPMGAMAVVDERESGSLQYILSNPISREEYLSGTFLGLLFSTSGVVAFGYAFSAALAYGLNLSLYVPILAVAFVAVILNIVMLSVALNISILTRRKASALGIAIFTWFVLSVLSNLNAFSIILNLSKLTDSLIALVFLDPVESARILGVMQSGASLNQVGVTGAAVLLRFGGSTGPLLLGSLLIWATAFVAASFFIFHRRDVI